MRKNLKRLAVLTLSVTMTAGSMMTVFAENENEDSGAATTQTTTGEGKYEGKDGELPLLSITLPTAFGEGVDYIADPNNLIGQVSGNGSLGSTVTVNANAGILFKSDANTYGSTSAKLEIENQNYQDVDVTVKLEQKTAGASSIIYADNATFETTDTANKLYLALIDDATTPQTKALSAENAAVLTTTLEGKKENYTLKYENNKYVYALNDGATSWNKRGFSLTGAINTKATWGEDVTFPEIQVTWSYAEHTDAVAAAAVLSAGNSIAVRLVANQSAEVAKITSVKVDGTAATYSVAGSGAILINGVSMTSNHSIEIVYDGTTYTGTFTAQ